MTSIAISGTSSLKVGGTTQLTATATLSNGTTQVVTGQATWTSSNTGVATVSAAGLVRSVRDGSVQITAAYQGQSGQTSVTVSPDVFAFEVKTVAFTARGSCDGILDPEGEFSVRVGVKATGRADAVVFQTTSYPSAGSFLELKELASRVIARTVTFDLTSREGATVEVEFRATEWDKKVVIIPPSVTDVRDSDMNDRAETFVHTFRGGAWTGMGGHRIGLGGGNCGVDLQYDISATAR
ncbi:MAG: Ig-like domain-containing protein [Vicinamibacterales bacterium]